MEWSSGYSNGFAKNAEDCQALLGHTCQSFITGVENSHGRQEASCRVDWNSNIFHGLSRCWGTGAGFIANTTDDAAVAFNNHFDRVLHERVSGPRCPLGVTEDVFQPGLFW